MKKIAYLFTVVAAVIALPISANAAGQAEYEAIADKMVAVFGKVVDQMETVTDEATADSAAAEIVKISKEDVPSITAEMKKIGKPSKEISDAIEAQMEPKMKGHMERMMGAMIGLSQKDPALMQKLQGAMETFGAAMEEGDVWSDEEGDAPEAEKAEEAPAVEEKEAA